MTSSDVNMFHQLSELSVVHTIPQTCRKWTPTEKTNVNCSAADVHEDLIFSSHLHPKPFASQPDQVSKSLLAATETLFARKNKFSQSCVVHEKCWTLIPSNQSWYSWQKEYYILNPWRKDTTLQVWMCKLVSMAKESQQVSNKYSKLIDIFWWIGWHFQRRSIGLQLMFMKIWRLLQQVALCVFFNYKSWIKVIASCPWNTVHKKTNSNKVVSHIKVCGTLITSTQSWYSRQKESDILDPCTKVTRQQVWMY